MTSTTAHAGTPRLERPRDGRIVAGAAAGIARHLNIDPTLVRLGFIVAAVAGGVGFAAYLAAYLLIPEEGRDDPVLRAAGTPKASRWAGTALLAIGTVAALDAFDGGIADEIVWAAVLAGAGGFLLLRTGDGGGDTAPVTEATVPMGPSPETTQVLARAPRRSRRATRAVAGVLLLVAAAASALGVDLGGQETVGIAVIAAGGVLVAGSFYGASPWLVVPPLLVAACAAALGAAGVAFTGPVGERFVRPSGAAAALPDEYRVAIGELHVDLRDVTFPEGTTRMKVSVGIGEAHVELPDDVGVRITGHAGAGDVQLPGGHSDGTDVDRAEIITAPGRPTLVLDVDAGLGEVRVERSTGR